ncbi:hypothetical protein PG985_012350 [Apiospora marii]|uniref:U6 snRNA phosphodiesterase n=1 Tax=Apiospora marii TaxID=335849 RepID=A0ABR1RDT3_9PEZI
MALLVDYSSSESDAETKPETKKRRLQASPSTDTAQDKNKKATSTTVTSSSATSLSKVGGSLASKTTLPPLPSAFHDLYASTVRVSTRDDPALHQGRKRQNPHVAGHWPSHLYTEWHPSTTGDAPEYETLTSLLAELSSAVAASSSSPDLDLKTFLTSDLGAPLPLHISLSRPLSLTTGNKDDFLDAVRASLTHGLGVTAFSLRPTGLEWHRTAESARSFLVLRVESVTSETSEEAGSGEKKEKNHELTQLLRRCNGIAQSFGQPALYAFAGGSGGNDDGGKGGGEAGGGSNRKTRMNVGDAFHISIAWSFEPPTADLINITREVFESGRKSSYRDRLHGMRIRVDGIKAKIGNVVTHIALPEVGTKGLFGV